MKQHYANQAYRWHVFKMGDILAYVTEWVKNLEELLDSGHILYRQVFQYFNMLISL